VMGVLALMIGAVEAHLWQRHTGARPKRRDLLQTDDLGPEAVRFFDVADIQHDVVDAPRRHRLGCRRAIGSAVGHRRPPWLSIVSTLLSAIGQCGSRPPL